MLNVQLVKHLLISIVLIALTSGYVLIIGKDIEQIHINVPFEYWAYKNDNNWPPSGSNPSQLSHDLELSGIVCLETTLV